MQYYLPVHIMMVEKDKILLLYTIRFLVFPGNADLKFLDFDVFFSPFFVLVLHNLCLIMFYLFQI